MSSRNPSLSNSPSFIPRGSRLFFSLVQRSHCSHGDKEGSGTGCQPCRGGKERSISLANPTYSLLLRDKELGTGAGGSRTALPQKPPPRVLVEAGHKRKRGPPVRPWFLNPKYHGGMNEFTRSRIKKVPDSLWL